MKMCFSSKVLGLIGSGLVLFLTSACDVRSELKEMHNNTKKMEGHTAKMVEITEKMEATTSQVNKSVEATNHEMVETKGSITRMAEKMDHLSETTDSLNGTIEELRDSTHGLDTKIGAVKNGIDQTYDGLRQGDSSAARRQSFEAMIKARSHEKKLSEAALYFAGFEFQLFNGLGLDAEPGRRDKMILGSVQQFFKDVYEVYNYNPETYPLADPDLGDAANLEASFNAIAAALHKDNPKQKEALVALKKENESHEEMHFLKIIKGALSEKQSLNSGKLNLSQISEINREVLNNEEIAVKLLQARWSFLMVSAMDKNVKFKKGGAFKYFISGWKIISKWELDFKKINSSALEEQHLYLKKAFETRELLTSIGVPTKTHFLVKLFVERMTPVNLDSLNPEDQVKAQEILDYLAKLKD